MSTKKKQINKVNKNKDLEFEKQDSLDNYNVIVCLVISGMFSLSSYFYARSDIIDTGNKINNRISHLESNLSDIGNQTSLIVSKGVKPGYLESTSYGILLSPKQVEGCLVEVLSTGKTQSKVRGLSAKCGAKKKSKVFSVDNASVSTLFAPVTEAK